MNTYLDELFLAANPSKAKDDIISGLSNAFAITNLGIMSNPLGIEFDFEFGFVYSYTLAGVKKSKATNDTVTAFRGR
jgi:hypothetical protein